MKNEYESIPMPKNGDVIHDLTNDNDRYMKYNKEDNIWYEISKQEALFDKLKKASQPLIDFLNENYDPMTIAVLREGRVDIFRSEMGMPLEVRD